MYRQNNQGCGPAIFGAAIAMLLLSMLSHGGGGFLFFFFFFMLPFLAFNSRRQAQFIQPADTVRFSPEDGVWVRQPAEPEPVRRDQAWLEREILQIAARNKGDISPAQVTMGVEGVDLATAKQALDAMAQAGHCTETVDDNGRTVYSFLLGAPSAATEENLSPEEWVKQVAGRAPAQPRQRMSGEQSVDDDLLVDN